MHAPYPPRMVVARIQPVLILKRYGQPTWPLADSLQKRLAAYQPSCLCVRGESWARRALTAAVHHHTHCCSGAGSHCLRHWCLHLLKCYAIYIVGIECRRLLQSSRHSVMVTTNHVMATPVIERAHSLAQCTLLLDQSHSRHYPSPAFASPVVNVQRACVSVGRGSLQCATSELPYRFELLILSTGLELGEPQLEEARRVLMLWQIEKQ